MSSLEYRRCDYLGCIASVGLEDEEFERWGCVLVQPNNDDEPRNPFDLCPEHASAMSNMLEEKE
jgi:hypothetical protein